MTIEAVAQKLTEVIKRHDADYIEAHLEESQTSHITYRGREPESIGRATSAGGNVRALVRGGWGFVSFNNLDELPGRVELAVKQAKFVGSEVSRLAPADPVVDVVETRVSENPVTMPLEQKKQVLDEYNEIIWRTPEIQTSTIGYADSYKKNIFLSSLGSYIAQGRADITLRLAAVATRDSDVQQVEQMARHAVELLSAPQAKGGEYTVVLDPVLAGVFVHEAFGHLSESDFVYENDRVRQLMTLGKQFGSEKLNIVDTATIAGLRGSYKYDDEGMPSTKTYLIREGSPHDQHLY
jgi:TldD protein